MVKFRDIFAPMDEISISKFKATCLAVLEKVRTTGEPIRVTKFGKPVADIQPTASETASFSEPRKLGLLAGEFEIVDDATLADVHLWHEDDMVAAWDQLMSSIEPKTPQARKRAKV